MIFKKKLEIYCQFVIILNLKFEFALSILAIYEIKLVILIIMEIALLYRLIYRFIMNNKGIKILDKAGCIKWKTSQISNKNRVISIYSDNILAKVYSIVIYKIYASLYSIKLGIKD